jgi:hypothetical protein
MYFSYITKLFKQYYEIIDKEQDSEQLNYPRSPQIIKTSVGSAWF